MMVHKHRFAGNGCASANSVQVTPSPDENSVSVLFNEMMVEAGGTTGKTLDSKVCSLSIPIDLPEGQNLAVMQVDYRGYSFAAEEGSSNLLAVDYYFEPNQIRRYKYNFKVPSDENIILTEDIAFLQPRKSKCSGRVNLNLGLRITTRTPARSINQTLLALDSLDAVSKTGNILFKLQTVPCGR
jgi:hypothetical protein